MYDMYVSMYLCMYVCMHACMYVYMHAACTHAYVHMHTHMCEIACVRTCHAVDAAALRPAVFCSQLTASESQLVAYTCTCSDMHAQMDACDNVNE